MTQLDKKKLTKLMKAAEDIQQVLINNDLTPQESIALFLSFTIDIAYLAKVDEEEIKKTYEEMWKGVKLSKAKEQ
jgi:hypothetical protein